MRHIESLPIVGSFTPLVTNPGADDGPSDDFSGHGTHVAGSVLGSGARAAALGLPQIQGMAPEAELVFQAIEQRPRWTAAMILEFIRRGQQPPASGLYGIPDDLGELLQRAFDQGARVHNNSWGGGNPGEYDTQCHDLDRFVWAHKDFLVVVAAGNAGSDQAPADGAVDPGSVNSPGTAKNCLTVGACENDRAGQFADLYGEWWPDDYPRAPLRDDSMIDTVDDIVAFSSRGPCDTGRRKPDLVAPGTFVLSTRSANMPGNNFSWGAFPPARRDYMYMGGTSMAAPLVSGCAALVRQHLRTQAGIATPSAALVKAALIHSARYVSYRFAHASSGRWADNEQGWGRVELASVLAPQAPRKVRFIDESRGLRTGEERTYSVEVRDASVLLRITLTYSDFPGRLLINNLNLILRSPGGRLHLGNDFAGTGRLDSENNVEGAVVERPELGTWTVRVVASEVLQAPQDFALVVSGGDVNVSGALR